MANALFGALPGSEPPGLGSVALPPAAAGSPASPAWAAAAAGLPHGVQAPGEVLPAGVTLAPWSHGPQHPAALVPGGNVMPASTQDAGAIAAAQPARLPKAVAGNGVPDVVFAAAPALDSRLGGSAAGVPAPAAVRAAPAAPAVPAQSPLSPQLPAPAAAAPDFYFLDAAGTGLPQTELRPVAHDAVARSQGVPGADELRELLREDGPRGVPARPAVTTSASPAPALPTAPIPLATPTLPAGSGLRVPAVPLSPQGVYLDDTLHALGGSRSLSAPPGASAHPPFDVHAIRRDFPILRERVNGRPLVWFDNAATTHKPQSVIDRLAWFYAHENSNIHRAAHALAARATDAYEDARRKVARFIGASSMEEIVFVRGTTEGINLVAQTWGAQHIGAGDEIIVSHLEHHANIVPWQMLAAAKGARLRVIPVDDSGQIILSEYQRLLNDRTRLVAVTQVSNALGTVVPVKDIAALAHRAGARVLIDGAQSVSHMRVDVRELDADFFVFSGHKVFGPTGIGAVYGRAEVLQDMPPWQGGGNMIQDVTFERTVYHAPPTRFEAGTGNIADAVGLGAALDYVERIGIENIGRYEHELLAYATQRMRGIPGVRLVGTAADKASVLSFVLDRYTTEEVGQALNEEGIAVRTGHHCAQPILRRFGLETTVRPSLAFYNTCDEVDLMVDVVRRLAAARR
ncbi:MAG: cysteine desulfurase [Burkholderiales bacterium]|nr:cysteine desulfurase [Burkholderiales bacterium]